jgi:hypothetical protein
MRKRIFTKAGEIICNYLNLTADEIMYLRDNEEPTILDRLDPVQLMIPVPKYSKSISDLEKSKTLVILNEILNVASSTLKERVGLIKIKND